MGQMLLVPVVEHNIRRRIAAIDARGFVPILCPEKVLQSLGIARGIQITD